MYLIRKMCGSGGCSKRSGCCFGSIFAFSAVRWEIVVSTFSMIILAISFEFHGTSTMSGSRSKMSRWGCFRSIFASSARRWEFLVSRFPVLINFSSSFSNFMYLIRRCLVAVLSSILFWRPSCKFSNLEVQFPLAFLSFFASLKCDLLWRSCKFVQFALVFCTWS